MELIITDPDQVRILFLKKFFFGGGVGGGVAFEGKTIIFLELIISKHAINGCTHLVFQQLRSSKAVVTIYGNDLGLSKWIVCQQL